MAKHRPSWSERLHRAAALACSLLLAGLPGSLVGPVDSLTFHFRAATERVLGRSVLEMHHSYLWLAVAVTLADGTTLENDFTTTGLSF